MKRVKLIAGLAGLAGLLIACLILIFGHKRSAATEAGNLANALVSGNASELARFVLPDDIQAIGMSEAQLHKFLEEYVCPKIEGSTISGLQTQQHRTNTFGYADLTVTTRSGRKFSYHCGVIDSDLGYVYPLREIVSLAWKIDYLNHHNLTDTTDLGHLAIGYYLERDVPTLQRYGYTGYPYPLEKDKVAPFEEVLAYQRTYCDARGLKW